MTVYDVLDYLASGMTEDDILHDSPIGRVKTSAPASLSQRIVSAAWQAYLREAPF